MTVAVDDQLVPLKETLQRHIPDITTAHVQSMVKRRAIASVKVGREWYARRSVIDAYIRELFETASA